MGFIIGLLTFVLVLDCIVLVFLVLIQLPKKEAGAGLAFGGAASDALFGAGSGNVLTKITKYAATFFFALSILLAFIQSRSQGTSKFLQDLKNNETAPISALPPGSVPSRPPATGTNAMMLQPEQATSNLMVAPQAAGSNLLVAPQAAGSNLMVAPSATNATTPPSK
jgi:preprotein translocase subunit SecG